MPELLNLVTCCVPKLIALKGMNYLLLLADGYGVLESLDEGNGKHALFRGILTLASFVTLRVAIKKLEVYAVADIDFYVKPNGEVVPATGYRYMDSKYAGKTIKSKSAPGSYFGFKKFDSASAARDAFQVSPQWNDCKVRGEFDTLQVIDEMYVPRAYGDKGPGLEPFTECYPEYGKGGLQQFIFRGILIFKNVKLIGD